MLWNQSSEAIESHLHECNIDARGDPAMRWAVTAEVTDWRTEKMEFNAASIVEHIPRGNVGWGGERIRWRRRNTSTDAMVYELKKNNGSVGYV